MGLAAPALAEQAGVVAVSAIVQPRARMEIMRHPPRIALSASDVRRGYVDVPRASVLKVVSTRGSGYNIDFMPRNELFTAVRITGFEGEVMLGSEGGSVSQGRKSASTTGELTLILSYRFFLAPGVAAGEYAWPLAMAVRAS